MRRWATVAVLAVSVLAATVIATAWAGSTVAGHGSGKGKAERVSKQLRKGLKNRGIIHHLRRFQRIANANGGDRAAGSSGYDASVDYVARKLRRYGWKVERLPFEFIEYTDNAPSVFERTAPDPATFSEGSDFSTIEYSDSGDVVAEVVAIDLTLPPPSEPGATSGCEASDFEGTGIAGRVALIQRGTCTFREKVDNAEAAGAAAVVIFNEGQPGRTEAGFAALDAPAGLPALDASFELGSELAGGTESGPTGTTVHIRTDTTFTPVETENVVAETRGGDRDRVVMAGAHLDSVEETPGINDNGSGSATLLELAKQISKRGIEPKHRLRLAWWSAEELGLLGSADYVDGLSNRQAARIALYLNFDMLASPNYARFVYDGNASKFESTPPEGSAAIERTFTRYLERQRLASGQTAFDGRSDYGPFIDIGIPAGGLFSGAEGLKTAAEQAVYGGTEGEAHDPCYHQPCDDIHNISRRGLRGLSDAVAHAVGSYAMKLAFVPRRPREVGRERRKLRRGEVATDYRGDRLRR